MVVAIGLATAIGCIHMGASVAARWHSLEATAIMLLSDIVAVIVGLVIFVVSRLSKQRKRVNLYWLSYCVASVSAVLASGSVAAFLRDREISDLIESGITVDCEKVLASHRHHPELAGEGYVRFLPGSKDFDRLPKSIRDFHPVYVTIEENAFGSQLPLNVGLCKMGFGGFHMGVRVFHADPQIATSWDRKRYSSKVYMWIDET